MVKKKINLLLPKDTINAVYERGFTAQERVQIYYGGAGSGKSVFLGTRTMLDTFTGRNTLCVRRVARTLKTSTFAEVQKAINAYGLSKYFLVNRSDLTITNRISGAQILFLGLDDVEKVKSLTPAKGALTDLWIEEATETKWTDFKQLEKRLRGISEHKKRITLSFNPMSKMHWIYRTWFLTIPDLGIKPEASHHIEDGLYILRTTYMDNKFLEEDDRRGYEGETDAYYKSVYTLGQWGIVGGAVFDNWRVGTDMPKSEGMPHRNGLDFGFSADPAAGVHTLYDKRSKTIYVVSEIYETGLLNNELSKRVKEIDKRAIWYCDSAEPKSIKELRRYGVITKGVKKGPDSIRQGINWLKQNAIIVSPECVNMIDELSNYKYKQGRDGVTTDGMEGADHLIDALRYAYEIESSGNKAIAGRR